MPYTVNQYLNVPDTGSLPGSWGTTAVNANMSALDGKLGGFVTISLSSATTMTLSVPAGAATGLTPGAGPTQSQNALIKFTGTLTGNNTINLTMPGYYIVQNACASADVYFVKLSPATAGGASVCAPPGQKVWVYFDGTDVDYVDMPAVGSALDLHTNTTTVPVWISNCTIRPYLVKDGSTYSTSSYTALAMLLGSTFGGNGVTTFGVPDERARARIAVDLSVSGATSARITATTGGAGVLGSVLGTSGGSQFMLQHTHTATDAGHVHGVNSYTAAATNAAGVFVPNVTSNLFSSTAPNLIGTTLVGTASITNANAGTGSSGNMIPFIISFLPLIKTVILAGFVLCNMPPTDGLV